LASSCRWFAALCAAAVLVSAGCGGGDDSGGERAGGNAPRTDRSFSSMMDFLADDAAKAPPRQVVFVGIDAAAWRFIDPLIARGALPNLARIKSEGASAVLRSIPCYVSPPAWTTMMTGYLPGRTGVYSYGKWLPEQREFGTVDATDVLVPRVWEVASHCGRRVGVFNVPMSYPPRPVDGSVVGGMMTPYHMSDPIHGRPLSPRPEWEPKKAFTDYSPVRRTATTDSLNTYLWSIHDTSDDGRADYSTVVLEVRPGGEAYTFALNQYSPWVRIRSLRDSTVSDGFMKVGIFETGDGGYDTRLSPVFASIDAPFTWPEALAGALVEHFGFYVPSVFLARDLVPSLTTDAAAAASWFYDMDDWDLYAYVFTESDNIHHHAGFSPDAVEVYQKIDRFVGELMAKLPSGATLVVASDHGTSEYEWGIDLNRMFEEMGLQVRTTDGRIDYDATLVFHNLWHLWFNRDRMEPVELDRYGIHVPVGANTLDTFADYLMRVFGAIQSEDGAHNVSLGVTRLHPRNAAEPDMRVDGVSGKYVVDFVYQNRHPAVFYPLQGHERWWHQRDGVVMAWGDNVNAGVTGLTYDIQDVAPTLLQLLGAPVAANMDGKVMDGLFKTPLATFTVPDYSDLPETPLAKKESTESLEKKLKSLGYLR
jgi:predicted AlkP superfamily phosphohydrolase/phosphomutase